MHDPALRKLVIVETHWLPHAQEVDGRAIQRDLLGDLSVCLIERRDAGFEIAAHAGPGAAIGAHALAAADQQNLVAARCVAQQKAGDDVGWRRIMYIIRHRLASSPCMRRLCMGFGLTSAPPSIVGRVAQRWCGARGATRWVAAEST